MKTRFFKVSAHLAEATHGLRISVLFFLQRFNTPDIGPAAVRIPDHGHVLADVLDPHSLSRDRQDFQSNQSAVCWWLQDKTRGWQNSGKVIPEQAMAGAPSTGRWQEDDFFNDITQLQTMSLEQNIQLLADIPHLPGQRLARLRSDARKNHLAFAAIKGQGMTGHWRGRGWLWFHHGFHGALQGITGTGCASFAPAGCCHTLSSNFIRA